MVGRLDAGKICKAYCTVLLLRNPQEVYATNLFIWQQRHGKVSLLRTFALRESIVVLKTMGGTNRPCYRCKLDSLIPFNIQLEHSAGVGHWTSCLTAELSSMES
jgi:hypothetical protein